MAESNFLNPTKTIRAAGVHEGMQVADLGAGSGFFTRAAARAASRGGRVWAVDTHRDMLPRVKNLAAGEGLTNVEVIYGDIEHPQGSNLPADSFDMAICANLLFGVEDKPAAIQEIHRVLKAGGRALVIDWSGSFGGLGPHPDHVITAEAARPLFEQAGFAYAQDIPAGAYHWGFTVRKK